MIELLEIKSELERKEELEKSMSETGDQNMIAILKEKLRIIDSKTNKQVKRLAKKNPDLIKSLIADYEKSKETQNKLYIENEDLKKHIEVEKKKVAYFEKLSKLRSK